MPIIAVLSGIAILTLTAERFAGRKPRVYGPVYVALMAAITIALFIVAPLSDIWAVLIIPLCIFVMRSYDRPVSYIWVAGLSSLVIGLLFIGHNFGSAISYGLFYTVVYIWMSVHSLALRQAEEAREQSRVLYERLDSAHEDLKTYAENAGELATLKERGRLSRELHDSVTQTLFSITLIAGSARILIDREPGEVPAKLDDLQKLTQSALEEMRGLVEQLRLGTDMAEDFVSALKSHIDEFSRRSGIEVALELDDQTSVPDHLARELFRIIQEAMNNIEKHSAASSVRISVSSDPESLRIEISDNGAGFDTGVIGRPDGHFGLKTMHERAVEIGGSLSVESKPGAGTVVSVAVPLFPKVTNHG